MKCRLDRANVYAGACEIERKRSGPLSAIRRHVRHQQRETPRECLDRESHVSPASGYCDCCTCGGLAAATLLAPCPEMITVKASTANSNKIGNRFMRVCLPNVV